MADMIIVEPIDLNYGAGVPFLTVSEGTGGANLTTPDPREIWVGANNVGVKSFEIDLGFDRTIDTLFLGNTNVDASSLWSLTSGTNAQGSPVTIRFEAVAMLMPGDDVAQVRSPVFYRLAVPIIARYLRVQTYKPAGAFIEVGNLIVGNSWKPTLPRELGAGRLVADSGARTRLEGGGLASVSGSLVSGFKWVFGDLDDADLAKLWGIMRRRKTTEPIVLIEDPGALVVEGVHYGTLVNLEGYERNVQSKSRWVLQMEDWI